MDRKLHSLLFENKETVAARWLDGLIDSYPDRTARFLRKEKDRFANPMGQGLARGIHAVVDLMLLDDASTEQLAGALDIIVRIRAVQELSVAQALGFVFELKQVVRDLLGQQLEDGQLRQGHHAFERWVDELALIAFEIYLRCKEQTYDLRVGEAKRRTAKLVERMNRVYGEPEQDEGETEGDRPADNRPLR